MKTARARQPVRDDIGINHHETEQHVDGAEHYTEAERLLAHAQGVLDDDSMDAGPRGDYASEDEYFAAIEMSEQASASGEQTASVYGQLAQVHATLAVAAATALPTQRMLITDSLQDWFKAVAGVVPDEDA